MSHSKLSFRHLFCVDAEIAAFSATVFNINPLGVHVLHHVLHHTASYYIILHHTTSYYIVLHHTTSYIILHHTTSYYIKLHRTTSYYIILHRTSYYIILHHATPYYITTSYHTATKKNISAFLSWCEHASHGSASYARVLQVLAVEFGSKWPSATLLIAARVASC